MRLRARLALTILVSGIPMVAGVTWARAAFERHTFEQGMHDFVLARMENGGREQCENSPETFPEPQRRGRPMRERPDRSEPRASTAPQEVAGGPARETQSSTRGGDAEPASSRGRDPVAPPRGPDDGNFGGGPPPDAPHTHDNEPDGGRGPGGRREFGGGRPPGFMSRPETWAYDPSFVSANPRAPAFPADLRKQLEGGDTVASTEWERDGKLGVQVAMRMPWNEGPSAIMLVRRDERGPLSAVSSLFWSSLGLCAALFVAIFFAAGPVVERVRRLTSQVKDSAAGRYSSAVDDAGSDEISELARAFNTAGAEVKSNVDALERRERALRTFVENTTHDVMLPLTVLQGHLSSIRRSAETGSVPDAEVVRDALEESHYVTSLLQNLAIAARLDEGELTFERHPVDMNALVERAVNRQRPIARPKQVTVDYAVPEDVVWIDGDVTLVEQMVSNVIHNAVRYNREGGHVAVLLETAHGDAQEFVLRVLDDGPGIPDELRERVLERSFRADEARSRHPDGLGLGLSIAKDVADRHGFQLEMLKSAEGGLEVVFRGPRALPSEPEPEAS